MALNRKNRNIYLRMKVCPLTRTSSPARHGHSDRQQPSGILGVYDPSGV